MKLRLCAFADEAAINIEGQIAALKRNNIMLIELRNADGKNVAEFSIQEAEDIKRKFDDNGIAVWSIGSPLGKSKIEEDFDIEKKKLDHILNLCEVFKCNKVRVFSFFTTEYRKYRKEVLNRLRCMCIAAKKKGVTLYHENEKEVYGDTVNRVRDLLDNIDGLGCIFDPANFIQCGQNITDAHKQLFDDVDYFHVKDFIKETGEIVPAGYGDGKIHEQIKRMKKDYVFTIEPHLAVFSGYDKIDRSEMKNKFKFESNDEAFDYAVNSIKKILLENNIRF